MSFLYGNNLLKSGLGRITEHTPAHTGVVVLSMSDVPLGFGISGKSTTECRTADPSAIVVFHQADVGESMQLPVQRHHGPELCICNCNCTSAMVCMALIMQLGDCC